MSRKHILKKFVVIENGDMSGNITGKATNVESTDDIAYIFDWIGTTPIGEFQFEISQDGVKFTRAFANSTLPVAGNTGDFVIEVAVTPYKFIRPLFVFSSGVGTLQASISGATRGA